MILNRARKVSFDYLGIKKVIPPKKMTSRYFYIFRTVKVVELFHQIN